MSSLSGSDRYRRAEVVKPPRPNDPVVLANTIPVIRVLRDLYNARIPEGLGFRSWKTYCPFGWEHPDGGVDKGFRVYEQTNTAFCFVQHGPMGPVRLAQMRWGGKQVVAARRLLEMYQLGQKRHWRRRYEEVLSEREAGQTISSAYVVEALHMALEGIPGYAVRQYEPKLVTLVESALESLDDLLSRHPSEAEIRQWYYETKDRLVRTIKLEVWGS